MSKRSFIYQGAYTILHVAHARDRVTYNEADGTWTIPSDVVAELVADSARMTEMLWHQSGRIVDLKRRLRDYRFMQADNNARITVEALVRLVKS